MPLPLHRGRGPRALGRSGEAHASLEHALAAAEPDGLYGPFLGGGEDLPELLKSHLRHGTAHSTAVTQVLGRMTEDTGT